MAKIFEHAYGQGTNRRNFALFAASSGVLYLLAILLGVMGGWDAAFPVLAVVLILDVLVLIAWIAFRPKNPAH
ncbi:MULTISPECIES: hypothetical protein [Streptomyces]|uniref:Uncharacterized protein n=1 Tax=Streptomyces parvulus TaxID=146923 RepID=A0A191V9U2_9ACTN|nr:MULTISPECIES: hypothetical protein [Streptomyces]ANJ11794.1 hypothetical protein Spa2297_32210 [Streptomyces parvulus]MZD52674.1 hypothetical protein [Streptomyces sp. SID5606]GGS04078.1 hypothetical protein GCM10010220_65510 [Streptomyces parvulus]